MSTSRYLKLNLNASSASTWSSCTAQPHYVVANANRIPPQDTEFSVEGTFAHSAVEALFKKTKLSDKATPDMKKHAQAFVDFCLDKKAPGATDHIKRTGMGNRWWSELKVSLFYMPARNGFVDFCCIADDGVHIADFKYGQGVAVSAFENLQMAIYARSMIQQLDLTMKQWYANKPMPAVHMHIYQPRVRQGDKQSTWTIDYKELVQFTDDRVLGPAEDIQAKALTLEFRPGTKTCQFCPCESFCEARTKWLLDDTPLETITTGEVPKLPKADSISDDVLSKIVLKIDDIKKWLSSAEKYATSMALNGKPLPGLKLVKGKGGHRKWGYPDLAKEKLLTKLKREDIITEDLITPTQVSEFEHDFEKAEWGEIQKLIVKPEGGPTLVSVDDPRPVYGSENLANVFSDETGAEDFC
jgi:hypothetical protein